MRFRLPVVSSSRWLRPLSAFTLLVAGLASAADRPNVIVFYTDDHGYADLSCQGVMDDIRTPNVDALAASGVRALHGYSTAPQCVPSRAGLMTGKFQARFGVEANGDSLDGFNEQTTIAERLQQAGYVTGQFGKWHLGSPEEITEHGFRYVYNQHSQASFHANMSLDAQPQTMQSLPPSMYHVDACSTAAAAVIRKHAGEPMFLYIAYRAPHVPLDAPQKYLKRFPGKMPQRRRQCLAMLSAVDDGVGQVIDALKETDLLGKTLIFYIGDNGAPLKIHKHDAPGGGPGWDGSLNDPLNGEKGMLSEGGMHVPFVISWPGVIPGGQIYQHPISALDVAATAAAIAGVPGDPSEFDGVNLIPFLSGQNTQAPHDALMWRWVSQAAIRQGDWKLLRLGQREYLFNLKTDLEEKHNLADQHPQRADQLRDRLAQWSESLSPPGLPKGVVKGVWSDYYDFYLDGKTPAPLSSGKRSGVASGKRQAIGIGEEVSPAPLWVLRGGRVKQSEDAWSIEPASARTKSPPFIARADIHLDSPVDANVRLKTTTGGVIRFSWRNPGDKLFADEKRHTLNVSPSDQWQTIQTSLPTQEPIIHLRLQFPPGTTLIQSASFTDPHGKSVSLQK